jgi:hypothetical protein
MRLQGRRPTRSPPPGGPRISHQQAYEKFGAKSLTMMKTECPRSQGRTFRAEALGRRGRADQDRDPGVSAHLAGRGPGASIRPVRIRTARAFSEAWAPKSDTFDAEFVSCCANSLKYHDFVGKIGRKRGYSSRLLAAGLTPFRAVNSVFSHFSMGYVKSSRLRRHPRRRSPGANRKRVERLRLFTKSRPRFRVFGKELLAFQTRIRFEPAH